MTAANPQTREAVPAGYKQTEVGVIPQDWALQKCSSVSTMITVGIVVRPTQYYAEFGVPALRSSNIHAGEIDGEDTVFITEQADAQLSKSRVRVGDVLTVRTGFPGTSAVVRREFAGANCIDLLITRPMAGVSSEFLAAWINSPAGKNQVLRRQGGLAQQHFNVGELRELLVALPSRAEQEAIAGALSDADAWIESLEKLIAKKRAIKQGAMQALLSPPGQPGHQRLPGFSGEWDVKRLGEVGTPCTRKNTCGDDLPVLTCSKHLGFVDSLGYFKNRVFSEDTTGYKVIFRGEIGYPANHVEEGSIGLQDLYDAALVSPIYVVFSIDDSVDAYFLHRLLKLDRYRRVFASATTSSVDRRGSLRWPAFSEIEVALPALPEQTAVATVLSDMDAEIEALEAKLEKAKTLKQGMMQELLTGKVRLVHAAAGQAKKAATGPKHSKAFDDAVTIAVLAESFGSPQWPLGRMRRTKLMYLMHRKAGVDTGDFLKKAAGPYNPYAKYGGPERIAKESGYVVARKSGEMTGLVAGGNIVQARAYFEEWYSPDLLKWMEQFKRYKNEHLELLATVDMAMQELMRNGEELTRAGVQRVIASEPEWLPKLSRRVFRANHIERAMSTSKKLFGDGA